MTVSTLLLVTGAVVIIFVLFLDHAPSRWQDDVDFGSDDYTDEEWKAYTDKLDAEYQLELQARKDKNETKS